MEPPSGGRPETAGDATLLRGVHVIPMDRARLLRSRDVLIRDGVIHSISPDGTTRHDDANPRLIEAAGKYLMPGLADGHPHPPGRQGIDLPLADYLRLTLAAGVTTLRFTRHTPDLTAELRELQQQGLALPQIFPCAAPLVKPPAPTAAPWCARPSP